MSVRALVGEYRENNADSLIRLSLAERAALNWAAIEEHDTVLSMNAGDGDMIRLLSGSLRANLCGLCGSDAQLAYLRESTENAAFCLAPPKGLPYRDKAFHVVLCPGNIAAANEPDTFREILRVMRPGGQLVMTDSALRGLWPRSGRAIMRTLRDCGFRNISCRLSGLSRVIMAWRQNDLPDRPRI